MKSSLFHLYFNNFRGMINNLYQSQKIYNYVNCVAYVFEVFFSTLVSRSVSVFDSSRHTKFHFTLFYFF